MTDKNMYVANFNLTFGAKDEPLLNWIDDFVLPALNSGIKRSINQRTKIMFEDVSIEEIYIDEYVLKGVIIKDTVIDIYNQYDEKKGLTETDQHHKTAPYSTFIVFLKNHRMVLVRNQAGSPDLRLFTSTIMDILNQYKKRENKIRKEKVLPELPNAIVSIRGITSETTIEELLKSVEKVKNLVLKLKPRNNEIGGFDDLLDRLDEKFLKTPESKFTKIIVNSPKSLGGVAKILNETEGLLESEIEVEYKSEDLDEGLDSKKKKTGKVKDNEIAQVININIEGELRNSFTEVYDYCKDVEPLNVVTSNVVDYDEYVKKRRK